MLSQVNVLKKFRSELYLFFKKRTDATMNLVDAISSYGHRARSVVQLSESPYFERGYGSITDAIADGLPEADWENIEKLTFETIQQQPKIDEPPCFLIDCTPNPRPFSNKLADRSITHAPNPAPGNKPICVGHQYSCVALLPSDKQERNKKWVCPLSMSRVTSEEKGNEVGMQKLIEHIGQLGLQDELVVSVGDSLYGSEKCREICTKQSNLVHIFRVNSKRNVFFQPNNEAVKQTKRGRKKEYGNKMSLQDTKLHPEPDLQTDTVWHTRTGNTHFVKIGAWENMLIRGSRKYRSAEHPMTLIKISIVDENGDLVFKKPLWIAIFGGLRDKISLISAFQYYQSRYDIEHFFRFSKSKLLLDTHQTANVEHEENWWRLCMVAHNQLYLAKSIAPKLPKPWEKYLPEYANASKDGDPIATPAQTQRGFEAVLNKIGTPAAACVKRGKAPGRKRGQPGLRSAVQDIIFKTKKSLESKQKSNIQGLEVPTDNPHPKTIDSLVEYVHCRLDKFKCPANEFTQMLVNST